MPRERSRSGRAMISVPELIVASSMPRLVQLRRPPLVVRMLGRDPWPESAPLWISVESYVHVRINIAVPMNRDGLNSLIQAERQRFAELHPNSRGLFEQAQRNLLAGVPMSWMSRWPGGHPIFAVEAAGARITDADGNSYVDLCLGDTGAMAGHAPAATAAAVAERYAKGATLMLPTEDSIWAAEELTPPLRDAQVAAHPVRDRCQSLRDPDRTPDHRPPRGSSCSATATTARSTRASSSSDRTAAGLERWQRRSAGRSDRDHIGGRVQRRRGPRAGPPRGGDRLRDDGAGAHQHRDRPARARVPRRAARADPGHRDPAPDRRDAHLQRRTGWLHRRHTAWSPTS